MKLRHKLQARLAMLVVAAVLPLIGFSVYTALRDARAALDNVKASLQLSASLAATSLDGVATSARNLLVALASASEVREGSVARCEAYVSQMREQFPQYANFGVIDADGRIRCSARSGGQRVDLSDRSYVRKALASGEFAVGEFIRGRVTGADSVAFAMPLKDDGARVVGVVYAALDLSAFSRVLADTKLPAGGRLIVMDRNGTVLAAHTDGAAQAGKPVPSATLRQAAAEGSAGVREGPDGRGRARIFAYAPAGPLADHAFMVSISMDREQVLAPTQQALWAELAALVVLAFLGGALAWALGGRALVRPVQQILDVAARVSEGSGSARVQLQEGVAADELVRVGEAVNRMAESLQQRQQELQAELARSQQAQLTQAMIFNSMEEGLWAVDAGGNLLLFNDPAARVFAVESVLRPPDEWPGFYGVYEPDSEDLVHMDDMPLYRALRGESGQRDIAVKNARVPEGCVLRCSYRPLFAAGAIAGAVLVFSDITELRAAAQQEAQTYARLRETQRRLVDALRIGRIGNWEMDLREGRLWWSDEVHEIFGIPLGQFDGRHETVLQRMHAEDRERYLQLRDEALRRGTPLDVEFRVVQPDGTVRWIHQRGDLHRDAAGAPVSRAGVVQDITTRKKSEAELFLLRSAVDRINDIVLIARSGEDQPGELRTVFANRAVERLIGYSVQAMLGKDVPLLYGAETDPAVVARIRRALARRQPVREQLLAYTRTGGQLWVEFDMVPFETAVAGAPEHWILVGRDVTGRKLAETALAESEQRYQALFEKAPLPMWVFDDKSARFLAANEAAVQQYGYGREEFLTRSLHDMRPAREQTRMQDHIEAGYTGRVEGWTHRRKDGTEFPVDVMSRPVVYGGVKARFAVIHDISARVKAEQNLQEYMFTLQRATDASQMVVSHQTLQGTLHEVVEQSRAVIRAHQAIVTLVNGGDWAHSVSAVSLSDKYETWRDFDQEPDGSGIYAAVCETNRPMRMTQQQLEAHPRWHAFGAHAAQHPPMRGWLAVPLTNRRGENIGVLQLTDKYEGEFTLQDEYVAVEMAQLASIALENVSLLEEVRALNAGLEHKVADRTRELAREQARYRALADQAPQIIWSYEPGRGVTYFNRTWYELVGGTPDYWLANRWTEAIHPDDRDASLANWVVARQSRAVYKGERRLRDKYGRYHIMSYRGAPVFDESGQVMSWVGIDTDVTEFKSVEAELRESNRELEAFSYSVSHDLRSPLNTIHGFSKLLARELGEGAPGRVPHYLERIQAATGYMGQLIEDLLSLAQVSRANLRSEPVDLSEIACHIGDRLRQTDPSRDVDLQVDDGMVVQGDVRLLRQVLENLVGNAWKFTAHKEGARIHVGSLNAGSVFFVKDNGAGFDMTYANKLFGLFQRLHAATEFPGTGIGLATVHRIITRHRGVWAHSDPGEGATFFWTLNEILLPGHGAGSEPVNQ